MDLRENKLIFLLISVLLVSIGGATATVDITSVAISPTNPETTDNLQCAFTLDGNESSYTADVIWMKDGQDYINEAGISASDNVEETLTLNSDETSPDQDWQCRVDVEGKEKTSNQVTIATPDKLVISDISAKCSPSCDDDDLSESKAMNGNAGTIQDVKPGATLTLKVKIENEWPRDTDNHDIEDNYLECTLEDIGDTDEIDEDVDFEDLEPGEDSSREELVFDVSEDAEHKDTYTIQCTLEGDDEDGTSYNIDFDVDLEVRKDKHDVVFTRATTDPSTISCDRNFQISYKVKNIGYKDEDDVQVVIRNSALGIFSNDMISELQEGSYDDDDTEYSKTRSFNVDDSVKAGTYTIRLEAVYDNGDEHEYQDVSLIVQECAATEPIEPVEKEEPKTEEKVEVVQQPAVVPTQTTGQVAAQPVTTAKPVTTIEGEKTAFTDSIWFVALLAVFVIILLVIAALLVVFLFKK